MKTVIITVLLLALAATAGFLQFSRKKDTNSYRFVEVEKGTLESVVSSTGTLKATSTVQVGTQVSGQIDAIYADFNDRVKQGQLIARIDPTLLQQEVLSAETAVERSQAERDQAAREMERAQRLFDQKAITESEFSVKQYEMALAKASNDAARINLDKARRNLKYTEIRAPVDGTVLERNVDVGQTVAASLSAPQLFLIAGDLSEMEIVALVDESDIGRIVPDQEVRFTVQAFPERKYTGTVRQVRLQSTTQENVVNYLVAVAVDNPDGSLLPGMTATVEFIVKRADDVLKVSNAAIRFQPTEAMRAEMRERRGGNDREPRGGADSTSAGRGRGGDGAGGTGGGAGNRAGGGFNGGSRQGGAWPGGSGSGARQRRSDRALLWVVGSDGRLDVVPVKTGITDGQSTQIEGAGVTEGMQVIAAVTSTSAPAATNPFENRSQAGQNRGPRPGF